MSNKHNQREIRVFLSSTFKDMEQERSYLISRVFPAVREACGQRNVAFTEVDLRWGVTEEESLNGEAIEICLEQIDRCRRYPPFFIGFLGERYGWVPTRAELEKYMTSIQHSAYQDKVIEAIDNNISVTELEMEYGILSERDTQLHALVYLRDKALTQALSDRDSTSSDGEYYDSETEKLNNLKVRLKQADQITLTDYQTIEQFGESVRDKLLAWLEQLFPVKAQPLLHEQTAFSQQSFAFSRRSSYVELSPERALVERYIKSSFKSEENRPMVIHGQSGTGKSSFLADLSFHLSDLFSNAIVIPYFIGVDGYRTLDSWKSFLVDYLSYSYLGAKKGIDYDRSDWTQLQHVLAQVSKVTGKKLILLLDALDQCEEPLKSTHLLSQNFNSSDATLIISSTCELKEYERDWVVFHMLVMSKSMKIRLIEKYSNTFRKKLSSQQLESIANIQATELPLYTKFLLENLRMHSSFDSLQKDIDESLSYTTPASLFKHIVLKLDKVFSTVEHQHIIANLIRLLAASRRGLSELEIGFLLANSSDSIFGNSGKNKVSAKLLCPILSVLRPYLLRDQGRERLMHNIMNVVALSSSGTLEARRHILEHFTENEPNSIIERLHQKNELIALNYFKGKNVLEAFGNDLIRIENLMYCYAIDSKLFNQILAKIDCRKDGETDAARMFAYHSRLSIKDINLESLFSMFANLYNNGYFWLAQQLLIKTSFTYKNEYSSDKKAFDFFIRKALFELKLGLPLASKNELYEFNSAFRFTSQDDINMLMMREKELTAQGFNVSQLYLVYAYSNLFAGSHEHAQLPAIRALSDTRSKPSSKIAEVDALLALALAFKGHVLAGTQPEKTYITVDMMDMQEIKGDSYHKASNLLRLVIKKQTQFEGKRSTSLILPLLHLSELYTHTEDYQKAKYCYEQCIDIVQHSISPGAQWIIPIAHSYIELGNKDGHSELYKTQLQIIYVQWVKVLPISNPVMFSFGKILESQQTKEYVIFRDAPTVEFVKMQLLVANSLHEKYATSGNLFGLFFWDSRHFIGHAHIGFRLGSQLYFVFVKNKLFGIGNETAFLDFCKKCNVIPCYVKMKHEHEKISQATSDIVLLDYVTHQSVINDNAVDKKIEMSSWDYYDIAVSIVLKDIEKHGYHVLSHTIDPELSPSICFIKDGKMCEVNVVGRSSGAESTEVKNFLPSSSARKLFNEKYLAEIDISNAQESTGPIFRGEELSIDYSSIFD
jgi:hypothetical protein